MTSSFPGALDNFQNPTPADNLNTPQVLHSDQHSNENDAIEAIEAWVGVSGTSASASHEYRIRQLEGVSPGSSIFGFMGQDEGIPLGTGTVLNVTGDSVQLSLSGTVFNLHHINPVFPQSQIGIFGQDEGVPLGTGTILNIVGNNADFSVSGTVLRLFVTGSVQPDYNIQFHLGDGQNVISTGSVGAGYSYVEVPVDTVVDSWAVYADVTGSLASNILKSTYAGFPPASPLAGLGQPVLASQRKNTGLVTGTVTLNKGDVLLIEVPSVSGIHNATVSLQARKSR